MLHMLSTVYDHEFGTFRLGDLTLKLSGGGPGQSHFSIFRSFTETKFAYHQIHQRQRTMNGFSKLRVCSHRHNPVPEHSHPLAPGEFLHARLQLILTGLVLRWGRWSIYPMHTIYRGTKIPLITINNTLGQYLKKSQLIKKIHDEQTSQF